MKKVIQIAVVLAAVLGVVAAVVVVVRKLLEQRDAPLPAPVQDTDFNLTSASTFDESELGGQVSPELLAILVCPEDRGPLKLSADGKWLINPRNGYRYPIRRGIPVMLIEEGRKYRDESLIEPAAS